MAQPWPVAAYYGLYPVTHRDRVLELLDKLSDHLSDIDVGDTDKRAVEAYADMIIPRLRSTFNAIVILINAGHLDEAVVLLRRQLEDSLRLSWLRSQKGDINGLVLGFDLARFKKVLAAMDRLINDSDVPKEDVEIIKEAKKPRSMAYQKKLKVLKEQGIELGRIPESFDELAQKTGRYRDIVVYASASEVSHSAMSALTQGYVHLDGDGKVVVEDISHSPNETATYANSAVRSTVTAVVSALLLRGRDEDAKELAQAGVAIEKEIEAIREEMAS